MSTTHPCGSCTRLCVICSRPKFDLTHIFHNHIYIVKSFPCKWQFWSFEKAKRYSEPHLICCKRFWQTRLMIYLCYKTLHLIWRMSSQYFQNGWIISAQSKETQRLFFNFHTITNSLWFQSTCLQHFPSVLLVKGFPKMFSLL